MIHYRHETLTRAVVAADSPDGIFSSARGLVMDCRPGCGACCIAPSISSTIPGMPDGKPAGIRCVQLTVDNQCKLFGQPDRPNVCVQLRPSLEMCGESNEEAMSGLILLEMATAPE